MILDRCNKPQFSGRFLTFTSGKVTLDARVQVPRNHIYGEIKPVIFPQANNEIQRSEFHICKICVGRNITNLHKFTR